jgi:hypothetical protein
MDNPCHKVIESLPGTIAAYSLIFVLLGGMFLSGIGMVRDRYQGGDLLTGIIFIVVAVLMAIIVIFR